MKYAGAKWETGCHPENFMTPDGYQTSSSIISEIISEDGLSRFEVINLITDFSPHETAYDYETRFLRENDCAGSSNWYNKHNNEGVLVYGSDKFKQTLVEKYGVEHPAHIPGSGEKRIETSRSRYGKDYPIMNDEIRSKVERTNIEKYGFPCSLQNEDVKKKAKETLLSKHGVENSMQLEETKRKHRETQLKNCGYDHHNKHPDRKSKLSEMGSKSMKTVRTCPHCQTQVAGPNYFRWHDDQCRKK
jgi:hypothetical protein